MHDNHPLNVHYSKTTVDNELKYVSLDDVLYHTYIEVMPKSEWENEDRESVIALSRKMRGRNGKLIRNFRASLKDISHYNQACVIDELDEAIDMARSKEEANTMITGIMNKAKILGMVTHKVENTHKGNINVEHEIKGILETDFVSRLSDAGIRVQLEDRNVIEVEAEK